MRSLKKNPSVKEVVFLEDNHILSGETNPNWKKYIWSFAMFYLITIVDCKGKQSIYEACANKYEMMMLCESKMTMTSRPLICGTKATPSVLVATSWHPHQSLSHLNYVLQIDDCIIIIFLSCLLVLVLGCCGVDSTTR